MEENVQMIAKKLWHVVRVAFIMLRKNMNSRKLLLDPKYLATKRRKLTGKSLTRKLPHHHRCGAYEFSCGNTPNHPTFLPFQFNHNEKALNNNNYPYSPTFEKMEESEIHAVNKVFDMKLTSGEDGEGSPLPCFYSPVLSGFDIGVKRRPVVRVTDSPYPLHDGEAGNYKVDEAAEEFIQRFYSQLRHQRITDA